MMTDRIRFHLDENVNPVVFLALQRYGINVTDTVQAGPLGSDDKAQLAHAKRDNRVIVTHDDDFLRLAALDKDHPGITFCHLQARTPTELIRSLLLVYEVLSPGEMKGQIEYL
jgi:predicted nuclease of predicted toxin-antitoxin system